MTISKTQAAIALGLAVAVGAGLATYGRDVTAVESAPAAARAPDTAVPLRHLPDFTELAEQVGPAVVNISTVQVRDKPGAGAIDPDHPLHDFLRRFGVPQQREERPRQIEGIGSGFIVSPDGFVLTNAHVVSDATVVTVTLTDKREFKARVVGVDKRTDVALLKIDATGLPAVRIGDASKVKVGEWVLAVGQPFGFANTVTAGIVSAKSRSLPDETLVPFLQTDVAINPGNSGGPLFNLNGEVIGINSQIYSRTGGYQGLSFAIPIDVAMNVKDQLQASGRVSRGKLGVGVQPVTPDLAQTFGLARPAGALVASVENGSPAQKAGVVPGDVVLAVNGQPVDTTVDLVRAIGALRPGQTVMLSLWRQGAQRQVPVGLAEAEPQKLAAAEAEPAAASRLGLALRPLAAAEARQLDVPFGLMVEKAEGAAARSGIQRGDVVLGVNDDPVASLDQFKTLLDRAGDRAALLIQRGDRRLFVPLRSG
jgi:serine protease Do